MSFEEFIYRIKDRISGYFNSENKFIRLLSRLASLAVFALVISTLAPTLADELSPAPDTPQSAQTTAPESQPSPSPSPSPTAEPSPSPSPTDEAQVIRPNIENSSPAPLDESSESATVQDEPPAPLEIQPKYTLRIPNTVAVDPRARTSYLPYIYAETEGAEFTLVCISGAGLSFDGKDLIAGETARVINRINSPSGLLVSSTNGGIANKAFTMRFIALTAPEADPNFCSSAKSSANIAFRPLGLEQSTVKGGGKLK